MTIAPLAAAPSANACSPTYGGGTCSPGACVIRGLEPPSDPTAISAPYIECYY